jgi:hypothetical protein
MAAGAAPKSNCWRVWNRPGRTDSRDKGEVGFCKDDLKAGICKGDLNVGFCKDYLRAGFCKGDLNVGFCTDDLKTRFCLTRCLNICLYDCRSATEYRSRECSGCVPVSEPASAVRTLCGKSSVSQYLAPRVFQHRIYTPYMTVHLMTCLPKIPYIYGYGQPYVYMYGIYIWSWPTRLAPHNI